MFDIMCMVLMFDTICVCKRLEGAIHQSHGILVVRHVYDTSQPFLGDVLLTATWHGVMTLMNCRHSVPSYLEGFMGLSAAIATIAIIHNKQMKLVAALGDQTIQTGGGSGLAVVRANSAGVRGGGSVSSGCGIGGNTKSRLTAVADRAPPTVLHPLQLNLLELVTAHFDQHCLWVVSAHREHLSMNLQMSIPALSEYFCGLLELIHVTDDPTTGQHLPRKLARLHYINFLFTIRNGMKCQSAVTAAPFGPSHGGAAASASSTAGNRGGRGGGGDGGGGGGGGGGFRMQKQKQRTKPVVMVSGAGGVACTPLQLVDNLLATLVSRLVVLSYDEFGALLLPGENCGWILSGVKQLLDNTSKLGDVLHASKQPTSERSASALVMLVCAVKHGDELATAPQVAECVTAAVKALPTSFTSAGSLGCVVTLRLLLSTVYFADTVMRAAPGLAADADSHRMLFDRIASLRVSAPDDALQVVFPLLGSTFSEWLFQRETLADSFGIPILRHEIEAASSGCGPTPESSAGTSRRFATLLTRPLAFQSVLKLLDAVPPKVQSASAPASTKAAATKTFSTDSQLWRTTCKQVLSTLCSVADVWQTNQSFFGSKAPPQWPQNAEATVVALADLIPPTLEVVLATAFREMELEVVDGSCDSDESTHSATISIAATATNTTSTSLWKDLIHLALQTLITFRRVATGLLHSSCAPTVNEIRIARLCAQQSATPAQTPQSVSIEHAVFPPRKASISFQHGMVYVHEILHAIDRNKASTGANATMRAVDEIATATVVSGLVGTVADDATSGTKVDTTVALEILTILVRLPLSQGHDDGGNRNEPFSFASLAAPLMVGTANRTNIDADLLVRLTRSSSVEVQCAAVKLWEALLNHRSSPLCATGGAIPTGASASGWSPATLGFGLAVRDGVPPLTQAVVVDRLARGLFLSLQAMIIRGGHGVLQGAACSLLSTVLDWTTDINPQTTRRLVHSEWVKTMIASAQCESEQARSALRFLDILLQHQGRLEVLANPKDLVVIAGLALKANTAQFTTEITRVVAQMTELAVADADGGVAADWAAAHAIILAAP
jgi:hypothetical protein